MSADMAGDQPTDFNTGPHEFCFCPHGLHHFHRLRRLDFGGRPVGFSEQGWQGEERGRLFFGQQVLAMVGHRGIVDSGQHFGRTIHRNVGIGIQLGAGNSIVRMDGGFDIDHCGEIFPSHLH